MIEVFTKTHGPMQSIGQWKAPRHEILCFAFCYSVPVGFMLLKLCPCLASSECDVGLSPSYRAACGAGYCMVSRGRARSSPLPPHNLQVTGSCPARFHRSSSFVFFCFAIWCWRCASDVNVWIFWLHGLCCMTKEVRSTVRFRRCPNPSDALLIKASGLVIPTAAVRQEC